MSAPQPPPLPQGKLPPPLPAKKPKAQANGVGNFLALLTIPTTIASAWFFPFWLFPRLLPQGYHPVILLAIPIVVCGIAPSLFLAWLLKLCGIPTTKEPDEKPKEN